LLQRAKESKMPQYLHFVIDGTCVANIATGNKSGTLYDVKLTSTLTDEIEFINVDTSVQSQPPPGAERERDFRNDFNHARRAIAAVTTKAEAVIGKLQGKLGNEDDDFHEISIYLRTNFYDRGSIMINPEGSRIFRVMVHIGTGPVRPPEARPSEVFDYESRVKINETHGSPLIVALKIMASEGAHLLDILSKEAMKD